jgi:hypothetical protein
MTYYVCGKTGDGWYSMKTDDFAKAQREADVMMKTDVIVIFSTVPIAPERLA